MALIAIGFDELEPPGTSGCWCCGDSTVQASLLRLDEHPEVRVCFGCARDLGRRKRKVERQTRAAPLGWPLCRRASFRIGMGGC